MKITLKFLICMSLTVLLLISTVSCSKTVEPEGDVGPFRVWAMSHDCECTPKLFLHRRVPYYPYADAYCAEYGDVLAYTDSSAENPRTLTFEGMELILNYINSVRIDNNGPYFAVDKYRNYEERAELKGDAIKCDITYLAGTDQPYMITAYAPMPTMKTEEDCKAEAIRLLSTYMGYDVSSYSYKITTYFDRYGDEFVDHFQAEKGNDGAIANYRYRIEFFNPIAEDAPFETNEVYKVTWCANSLLPRIDIVAHRTEDITETTKAVYRRFEECKKDIYTYVEEVLADSHKTYSDIRIEDDMEKGKNILFVADGKVWIICHLVGTFSYEDGERGEQELAIALSYDLPTEETS